MAPPPEIIDDVAGEIFLRLPPDEPEHLVRTSLVCKPWFRLLTDPGFLRCYRAFHRTPPLLGYLERRRVPGGKPERGLVPATSASLAPNPDFIMALDCHHGRVLFRAYDYYWYFVVWDPITGDRKRVPDAGIHGVGNHGLNSSAAVCCAVSGCDHLECHGGPFRVVFIASDNRAQVKACVYSSETGAWSTPVTLGNDCEIYAQRSQGSLDFQLRRGAVIGDEIYFTVVEDDAIVKYDLRKNCLSMINPPKHDEDNIALMEMEDGSLGFVCIRGSRLYLWSRKVNSEGAAEWVQCKVFELGNRIPVVVGAAEGVGVIFVSTDAGLFTIKVSSRQVKKIDEPGAYFSILPFMSFYTPDCGTTIASKANVSTNI